MDRGARTSQPHIRQTAPNSSAGEELHAAPPRDYVDLSCAANCVLSTALAWILCRRGCDAGTVIAEFAFFPPEPPTYALLRATGNDDSTKKEDREEDEGRYYSQIEFNYQELDVNPEFSSLKRCDGSNGRPHLRVLETSRGEFVPSFFFESSDGCEFCLIYFHANATDCGAMLPTYANLRRRLRVNLLAVEYCGYGGATGVPSVRNTLTDAAAASAEASRRGFGPEKQVLYGQSVGSGPACHLAARSGKVFRALVLHAPIASGIRALAAGGCCSPVHVYAPLDPFNNLREIRSIACPVFIIHGTCDEEIPWAHGRMLYSAALKPSDPFWVQGAGHNNVVETAKDEYYSRLGTFLRSLS